MLIYPLHDPRRTDQRLYKGGDGGAGAMRQQEQDRQRQVQAAVDAINGKFGVAPASAAAQPTADQFTTRIPDGGHFVTTGGGAEMDSSQGWVPDPGSSTVDETGYAKALADWKAAQDGVGAAKTARDSMYSDISGAVRDSALRDLDQQYTKASRNNVFGLARSGLLGGSADAESGGDLQRVYGEGRMRAEQQGVQAAADLRGQDEQTRQHLVSLAQSGLDTGTAASMAEGQMSSAAQLAKSQAQSASVGDLFSNMGQAYLTNRVLAARYPNGMPATGGLPFVGGYAPSYQNSSLSPGAGYVGNRSN